MDDRRKRLFYRAAHRGIKEMDLILTSFARQELPEMNEAELLQFEALMDVPDHDLYYWITGANPTPTEHQTDLMARLRAQPPVGITSEES